MREEPDIRIGPLDIWVTGRPFEEAGDYWDANWLDVRAEVRSSRSTVSCEGTLLRIEDHQRFLDQLASTHGALAGVARLDSLEPNLKVQVVFRSLGKAELIIDITPDHLGEQHRFHDGTDQTYLRETIHQIRAVLSEYPVVGTPPGKAGESSVSKLARIGSVLADAVFGKKDPT